MAREPEYAQWVVAGEEFVSAIAAEGDGDLRAGLLAEQRGGTERCVRDGSATRVAQRLSSKLGSSKPMA
jgi:hypothetical protein